MSNTDGDRGSCGGPATAAIEDLEALLREAFDAEFCCCVKQDAWQTFRADQDAAPPASLAAADLSALLDRCLAEKQPVVTAAGNEGHVLALPFDLGPGLSGAAVGHLRVLDPAVILRTAKVVLRAADATGTCRLQEQQLDLYARHVSQCFEELAWLRELTGCIDFCDATNQLPAVAAEVLPSLREVLAAESLALIRASGDGDPVADGSAPLEVSFQAGGFRLAEDEYLRLVRACPPGRGTFIENHPAAHFPTAAGQRIRSFIVVRIAKHDRLFGWLVGVNKTSATSPHRGNRTFRSSEFEFGTFEAGLLESAAVVLATQASNAELFRESESMFVGVIRALAGAIDAKDPYTCGHSDRVARIARRLAEELGLDATECERVHVAGLLHDIGKIGVRDEVLLKPGKLTDAEFDELKKHPEIGFSILDHLARLQPSLPGVLHHHERIDGQGYPGKLAGAEIPLPARIISVADAFDAMTSCRPYRTAMSFEKAESILRELAGVQWDARVVEAFFSALPDIRAICEEDSAAVAKAPAANHFSKEATAAPLAAHVTTAHEGAAC
jgi:HD-GYP domain-containing protein (c-di-GMP phosphodiesterase class II)